MASSRIRMAGQHPSPVDMVRRRCFAIIFTLSCIAACKRPSSNEALHDEMAPTDQSTTNAQSAAPVLPCVGTVLSGGPNGSTHVALLPDGSASSVSRILVQSPELNEYIVPSVAEVIVDPSLWRELEAAARSLPSEAPKPVDKPPSPLVYDFRWTTPPRTSSLVDWPDRLSGPRRTTMDALQNVRRRLNHTRSTPDGPALTDTSRIDVFVARSYSTPAIAGQWHEDEIIVRSDGHLEYHRFGRSGGQPFDRECWSWRPTSTTGKSALEQLRESIDELASDPAREEYSPKRLQAPDTFSIAIRGRPMMHYDYGTQLPKPIDGIVKASAGLRGHLLNLLDSAPVHE